MNPLEAVLEHEEHVDQELLGAVFGDLLFRPLQPEVFGDELLEWAEADVDRIAENCADVGRLPTGPGSEPDCVIFSDPSRKLSQNTQTKPIQQGFYACSRRCDSIT